MAEVTFVDTSIRDGQQSLWANHLRTGMILPVASMLARAGFEAIELTLVDPKKAVRELREDPWERIRLVRQLITETPLRMVAGRYRAFQVTPHAMYELYLKCMAKNGIRQTRVSEEWNQLAGWERKVKVALSVGIDPYPNLIYSVSPRHTDEYYAERARQAASLPVSKLCLKDPGGLLTPERMRTLVPAIQSSIGGKPLELHSHCTTGLGPLNALEAVKLGIHVINVAIPPLADGSSLPSVYTVAQNLRAMGHKPLIDEDVLKPVSEHLTFIARREGLPIGAPVEYDVAQYAHQIPGGMISNLAHQLKLVGLEHKLPETLEEAAQVRADLGYPIMVTPLSQFVGSQAAINVIVGERYKEVTDQVIHYALGRWGGQEAIAAMDPSVRDKVLARSRARELAAWEPPEPTIDDLWKEYGGPGVSEEELLLRFAVSREDIARMRSAGPPSAYRLSAGRPLLSLLQELTMRTDRDFIHIEKGGLSITLARRPGGSAA